MTGRTLRRGLPGSRIVTGETAMEELLNAVSDGAIWGIGFGLATMAVRSVGGARPIVKGAMRGAVTAGSWIREAGSESRESLQDLYHEAKAEREAAATRGTQG